MLEGHARGACDEDASERGLPLARTRLGCTNFAGGAFFLRRMPVWCLELQKKYTSAIGTRTRVSWVKAKYDNHLHSCPCVKHE